MMSVKKARRLGLIRQIDKQVSKGEVETHFGCVLKSLQIRLICEHSPHTKGRIENTNGTLQDQLFKEMRAKGISNIEEANRFYPGL